MPLPCHPPHSPLLPPNLPGCGCGVLWPPRSARPLAMCCSRGTSTAVSQDSDCRSPGKSSSPVVARSLQGGAGAQAGRGALASSWGGSPALESPLTPPLCKLPQSAQGWAWEPKPQDAFLGSQNTHLQTIPSPTYLFNTS